MDGEQANGALPQQSCSLYGHCSSAGGLAVLDCNKPHTQFVNTSVFQRFQITNVRHFCVGEDVWARRRYCREDEEGPECRYKDAGDGRKFWPGRLRRVSYKVKREFSDASCSCADSELFTVNEIDI